MSERRLVLGGVNPSRLTPPALPGLTPLALEAAGDLHNKEVELLRIYDVSLDVVAKVRGVADSIGEFDRDQARQLRRSCMSIPLNISEGSGVRGGNRRVRYETALGSARETRANIQVAVAVGYLATLDTVLDDQLDHIIATLVKLVR